MTKENNNTEKQCDIHVVRENLSLGNFTINKQK